MTFSSMKHVQDGSKPANSTLLDQLNKRNLLEGARSSGSKVDNTFFGGAEVGAHVKGVKGMNAAAKPDKKHNNRGKREKLRRLHVDLDA
ncbi:hypothetical protein AAVH_10226 [Aphelenchoides avenae]|nr:hypothetical protein AAVH_10226 [Aphelenchus avenae]